MIVQMSREERLQEIYDDQGRPDAEAFRFAARRKGLEISEADARAFVAKQSIGQVFQGRIPSDGVVPGGGREVESRLFRSFNLLALTKVVSNVKQIAKV